MLEFLISKAGVFLRVVHVTLFVDLLAHTLPSVLYGAVRFGQAVLPIVKTNVSVRFGSGLIGRWTERTLVLQVAEEAPQTNATES